MKKKLLSGLLAVAMLASVVYVLPAAVSAEQSDRGNSDSARLLAEDRGEELKKRIQDLKEQRATDRQQRLTDVKLRVCENRKSNIERIMNRAITRAERQLKLFTTIADRVKAFYEDKGLNVENYDELVAAVDAAKAKAEADLETLKGMAAFECDAEDPKGSIEAFKLALQTVNQDLKDYRTAVKDLIVGVKSAARTDTADNQEGSDQE